jgi:hypothetical protein
VLDHDDLGRAIAADKRFQERIRVLQTGRQAA